MPTQTSPTGVQDAVTIRGLRKEYKTKAGAVTAVDGVDLTIAAGHGALLGNHDTALGVLVLAAWTALLGALVTVGYRREAAMA